MRFRDSMKRHIFFILAWICLACGFAGVFIPILPTTPLILLACFLFTKSSKKYHDWLISTSVYKKYVQKFHEKGGITASIKIKTVLTTLIVMTITAILVPIWYVWVFMGIGLVCEIYFMMIKIPTIPNNKTED